MSCSKHISARIQLQEVETTLRILHRTCNTRNQVQVQVLQKLVEGLEDCAVGQFSKNNAQNHVELTIQGSFHVCPNQEGGKSRGCCWKFGVQETVFVAKIQNQVAHIQKSLVLSPSTNLEIGLDHFRKDYILEPHGTSPTAPKATRRSLNLISIFKFLMNASHWQDLTCTQNLTHREV